MVVVAAVLALSSCATQSLRGTDLTLHDIHIVAVPEPAILRSQQASKETPAVQGAATGAIAGALSVGVLSMIACLPVAMMAGLPGVCAATLPGQVAVGATVGGAVGAAWLAADSSKALRGNGVLVQALENLEPSAELASKLQRITGISAGPNDGNKAWVAEIEVISITPDGGLDNPIKWKMTSRLSLRNRQATPAVRHTDRWNGVRVYRVSSKAAARLEAWQRDEGWQLRQAVLEMIQETARQMAKDLG